MKFVKLTEKLYENTTREIYVNLEHIIKLTWDDEIKGTEIIVSTGRNTAFVKETPEQILVKTKAIGG